MRFILPVFIFVFCVIAISKAIVLIVPVEFFYDIADVFPINGDEAIPDFVLTANIVVSVLMSVALLWMLKRIFRKH